MSFGITNNNKGKVASLRGRGPAEDVVATQIDDHPHLAPTVLTVLKRERDVMVRNLASTRAKDYAEYLNWLGRIEGLDIAISHTEAQAKKLG